MVMMTTSMSAEMVLLHTSEALADFAAGIMATDSRAEDAFLELCAHLRALSTDADLLITHARGAAGQGRQTGPRNALQAIEETAQASLGMLARQREQLAHALASISDVQGRLWSLQEHITALNVITKRLRTMRLYFDVESARTERSAHTFSGFSKEINELVTRAMRIAHGVSASLRDAQAEHAAVEARLRHEIHALRMLADDAERAVAISAQQIGRMSQSSRATLDQIAASAQRIGAMVGEIIMGIEFRDITRQQLEHTTDALLEMARRADAPADEATAAALLPQCRAGLALQHGQLGNTIDAVQRAHGEIDRALGAILAITPSLTMRDDLVDACEDTHSETSALLRSIQQIARIIARGEETYAHMQAAMVNTATALDGLVLMVDEIDEINSGVSLLALNAVVNAIRLGDDGRALAKLADEVSTLSTHCDAATRAVTASVAQVHAVVTESRLLSGDTGGETGDGEAIDQRLQAYLEECGTSLTAARDVSGGLRARVDRMADALAFLPSYVKDLVEIVEAMAEHLHQLTPWQRDDQHEFGIIEGQMAAYTMEGERAVHRTVLGSQKQVPTAAEVWGAPRGNAPVPDDDWLGDNVELF